MKTVWLGVINGFELGAGPVNRGCRDGRGREAPAEELRETIRPSSPKLRNWTQPTPAVNAKVPNNETHFHSFNTPQLILSIH